jgi:hypothetical protein
LKEEDREGVVVDVARVCNHCKASPCILNTNNFYETLMEFGEQMFECNVPNREIRYRVVPSHECQSRYFSSTGSTAVLISCGLI